MENFPNLLKKLWSGWEIRIMVSLSLLLQIILTISAPKRRSIGKMGIIVWSCYLAANFVATFTLGNLAILNTDCKPKARNFLQAFWAPFLLLHLGGPDTITAFSLEDNELWLRNFLGLIVQVLAAISIFWSFLSNHGVLMYASIPLFVAGIIKYGERSWVLRSSSATNFRESLLAGPKYEKDKPNTSTIPNLICEGDYLFKRFKYIYTDLVLSREEIENCLSIIRKKDAKDAFKLVEIELGFMYDTLYTKATLAFSKCGIIFRFLSFTSTICALVLFMMFINKKTYPAVDIVISYSLIGGAICLEFYAIITLILSDRTYVLVSQKKLPQWVPHFPSKYLSHRRRRWSGSIPQLSLMDIIIKSKMNKCVQKSFTIVELVQNYQLANSIDVTLDLQKFIFEELAPKSDDLVKYNFDIDVMTMHFIYFSLRFDKRLLRLHIATELCYQVETDANKLDAKCKISKCLSDYLLYLVVMCPSMLPKTDTSYRETCEVAVKYFEDKPSSMSSTSQACKYLLANWGNLRSLETQENKVNSALRIGCSYAGQLIGTADRWERLSKDWMELLMFATGLCNWKEHGQQLRKGGEFLTHVTLLMAHLGLCPQFVQSYTVFRDEVQIPSGF